MANAHNWDREAGRPGRCEACGAWRHSDGSYMDAWGERVTTEPDCPAYDPADDVAAVCRGMYPARGW